jgi:hypothetical protein
VFGKLRRRIHKAAHLNTANDAIKIAAAGLAEMREHIQSAYPRGLAPVFHCQLGTKLALNEQTIERWQLTGEIDQRVTYHDRNVVSPRHLNFWEGYAELLQTVVDASSHVFHLNIIRQESH